MQRSVTDNGGHRVEKVVLEDGAQRVTFLSIGACLQDWRIAHHGADVPVVLGYEDPLAYFHNSNWFGAIAGPVANRINGGGFSLGQTRYDLNADRDGIILHSGDADLSRRVFTVQTDQARNAVRFEYTSPHGEGGFPGLVLYTFDISFRGGVLTYDMHAMPDRPTPVALAQHNYYNLMGRGEIWDHDVMIAADRFTPLCANGVPDGTVAAVTAPLNFQNGSSLGVKDPQKKGFDHNLVLHSGADRSAPIARVRTPNGLCLEMWSDQPAVQLYTGSGLPSVSSGIDGRKYGAFSGLCIEPQIHPNSINTSVFPSPIVTPDTPYHQRLVLQLSSS